ncbi:MAG: hypothetical protein LBK91_06590 [Synergistaceae bacterium]|nr:hypothetical protein [Synergistaceae bacterium]
MAFRPAPSPSAPAPSLKNASVFLREFDRFDSSSALVAIRSAEEATPPTPLRICSPAPAVLTTLPAIF